MAQNHPRLVQNNEIKQKVEKLHKLKGKKISTPTPPQSTEFVAESMKTKFERN